MGPEEAGRQLRGKEVWNRNKVYTLALSVLSYATNRLWGLKSFKSKYQQEILISFFLT